MREAGVADVVAPGVLRLDVGEGTGLRSEPEIHAGSAADAGNLRRHRET